MRYGMNSYDAGCLRAVLPLSAASVGWSLRFSLLQTSLTVSSRSHVVGGELCEEKALSTHFELRDCIKTFKMHLKQLKAASTSLTLGLERQRLEPRHAHSLLSQVSLALIVKLLCPTLPNIVQQSSIQFQIFRPMLPLAARL